MTSMRILYSWKTNNRALDPGSRLQVGLLLTFILLVSPVSLLAQQRVTNPVPEPITKSGLTIVLEDFVQVPASDPSSSTKARINMLRSSKDGSGRLFVNDLRGKLHLIQNGVVSDYLDLAQEMPNFKDSPGLGSGFGSFAFHPEFASNGKFYTAHSEEPGSGTADLAGPAQPQSDLQGVVTEWTASDPAANVFAGTNRELLRIDIYRTIHGLQDMGFNPNAKPGDADYGNLYICQGDGGGVDRSLPENSHRLDSILGTILRIDPMGSNSRNGKYGIPADNPYANDNDDNTLDEIYVWGFRNPHRISWDTGGEQLMLIGEIGQHHIEEINIGVAGADYGWNVREGTFVIDPKGNLEHIFELPANDSTFGYTYPVAQYDHDEGDAIVGGYVYRGAAVPELTGMYVFGDIKKGRIFYVPADSLKMGSLAKIHELTLMHNGEERELIDIVGGRNRADLRFGIDDDGELYVLSKVDGSIRKVVSTNPGGSQYPLLYAEDFSAGSGNWVANLPENWQDSTDGEDKVYQLIAPGPFGTPRRPTSSSILTPYTVGNFELEVVARSDQDSTVLARDICLFFGYQDSLQFYYSHFAGRSADVHNIIGMVNNADREKINVEAAGTTNPRLTDFQYHTLKVVRSVESGSIEAFFDDELIMTAVDTTFTWGKIGIGSFDDIATFRSVKLWGELITTEVMQGASLPSSFSLRQNYPNPFNPTTTIAYALAAPGRVNIAIYNALGQKSAILLDEVKSAGQHSIRFDATDFASGSYYYEIRVSGQALRKKMLLIK